MILLEVRNLTKCFGALRAVDKINFIVKKGDILGLIGPNGAGKSTVFNLLTSYLKVDSGNIIFLGKDITSFSTYKIARLGIVRTFQEINLYKDMTVFQNVMLSHHIHCHGNEIDHFFNTVKEKIDIQFFEEDTVKILDFFGISRYKDEKVKNLPYGHLRLLETALALSTKPKLLLLDEPFTGMNSAETTFIMEKVRNIRDRGITIILVEHNMRVVMEICNRIVVMNFGKKIAEGNHEEIKNNNDVIEAYLGKYEGGVLV